MDSCAPGWMLPLLAQGGNAESVTLWEQGLALAAILIPLLIWLIDRLLAPLQRRQIAREESSVQIREVPPPSKADRQRGAPPPESFFRIVAGYAFLTGWGEGLSQESSWTSDFETLHRVREQPYVAAAVFLLGFTAVWIYQFIRTRQEVPDDRAAGKVLLEGELTDVWRRCEDVARKLRAITVSLDRDSGAMEVLVGGWNTSALLYFNVTRDGADQYWVRLRCHTDKPTKRSAARTIRIVQRGLALITGLRLHPWSGNLVSANEPLGDD